MNANPSMPIRGQVLADASSATLKSRQEVYGDCSTDMTCAAAFAELYAMYCEGKYSAAHEEAMHRVFIKLARIACGAFHLDNYVDLAAYIAIAAEVETVSREAEKLDITGIDKKPKEWWARFSDEDLALMRAAKETWHQAGPEESLMQTTGPLPPATHRCYNCPAHIPRDKMVCEECDAELES